MSIRNILLGAAALALAFGSTARAVTIVGPTSIGANFLGRSTSAVANPPENQLGSGDTAGVVAQPNWNNIANGDNNNNTSGALINSNGTVTGVTLQWSSNDSWSSDGGTSTPDEKLTKGIIKVQGVGNAVTLTFHNVPAGTYDLIATTHTNGAGSNIDVASGGTTYYITESNAFDGTYTQGTSTNPLARTANADYVRFTGVSPVGGDLTLTSTWQGGTDGGSLSSIQLVSTPEPATLGLLGLGSLGLLARRRRA